jgi:predicted kinase
MIYGVHNIISTVEFDLLDVCVCELLKQGRNVVVDATNLKKKHRAKWASIARMEGHEFEVKYFDVYLAECIKRNEDRRGQSNYVPPEQIIRMSENFEVPTESEGHMLSIETQ